MDAFEKWLDEYFGGCAEIYDPVEVAKFRAAFRAGMRAAAEIAKQESAKGGDGMPIRNIWNAILAEADKP